MMYIYILAVMVATFYIWMSDLINIQSKTFDKLDLNDVAEHRQQGK